MAEKALAPLEQKASRFYDDEIIAVLLEAGRARGLCTDSADL